MKEENKKQEESLNGVGGWLAFFVVTIMIISPILSFSLSFSDTQTTTTWDFILILAEISVMILAGIFLIQKKYYAVTFTKIVLWGMLISIIFNFFASAMLNLELPEGNIFYPIIWLWYFSSSERVRQTYGHLKEPKEGFLVWSKLAIIYGIFSPIFGLMFSGYSLYKISENNKIKGMLISIIGLLLSIGMIVLSIIGLSQLI